MSLTALFALLWLAWTPLCPGQTSTQVVRGKVVSEDGVSISGVEVYGRTRAALTTTKAHGEFTLRNPGPVLHFRRVGLAPSSVVNVTDKPLTVVMTNQRTSLWPLEDCRPDDSSRFGGNFRFQRPSGVTLQRSHDIDFVRLYLKGLNGGWLDAWFGSQAGSIDADDELYLKSKSFCERFVEVAKFGIVGIDARGVFTNGRFWRWLGLNYAVGFDGKSLLGRHPAWHWRQIAGTHMLRYEDATESEGHDFDKVIDSVCVSRDGRWAE